MSSPPEKSAHQLAAEFLTGYRSSGDYLRDNVARLAQLAMSDDLAAAESATAAIFASLVEPLGDSFDPSLAQLYDRVFAQIIQHCRRYPKAHVFDRELGACGLDDETSVIERGERLRQVRSPGRSELRRLKRVIVLSRVTLGADVAISSVIIERFKQQSPSAEIVVIGGVKLEELFGGDSRLVFERVDYQRAGGLLGRLLSWTELRAVVKKVTAGLQSDEYLIVDPDSRLTQLGLLPASCLAQWDVGVSGETEGDYLFFPSRVYGSATDLSLGRLTDLWLGEVLGESEPVTPRLSLRAGDVALTRELIRALRQRRRQVVTINFGVGENPHKRVGEEFERGVVTWLVRSGVVVVLDRGAGEDESRRVDALIRQDGGWRVLELNESALRGLSTSDPCDVDVVVWRGRVGILAALIAGSDAYIGYDSAGQHIAAALGVPCVDVFAGFSSLRMVDRWRPTGRAEVRVVVAGSGADQQQVLTAVSNEVGRLLGPASQDV